MGRQRVHFDAVGVARAAALLAWHWLILALLLLSGAVVVALRGWAARRSDVVFLPEPEPGFPGPRTADS